MVVNDHFLCDNFSCNRGKLSHHIRLHEKWYPNSIEQKYYFKVNVPMAGHVLIPGQTVC